MISNIPYIPKDYMLMGPQSHNRNNKYMRIVFTFMLKIKAM